jgi:hypothetical protein
MARSIVKKVSKPEADPPANHHDWIAQMAYYLAEKRGFAPGGELADWYEAERLRAGEA